MISRKWRLVLDSPASRNKTDTVNYFSTFKYVKQTCLMVRFCKKTTGPKCFSNIWCYCDFAWAPCIKHLQFVCNDASLAFRPYNSRFCFYHDSTV